MPVEIGPGGGAGLWLLEQVENPPQSDECLIWPFSRNSYGYGQVSFDGKVRKAHRVVCELVNGPPPAPKHHAAHNCGNGSAGCIHPRHVEWTTALENKADSISHGTAKAGGRKLTSEQVAEIRALRGQKTQPELAAIYGVRTEAISLIHRGASWRNVRQSPRDLLSTC